MPGELSTVGANAALDGALGRATQTARTVYLALLTGAPSDTTTNATMAEISTAGYARQSVAWSAPSGDPSSTANSGIISFGPFSADPPNVTHVACVSSSSGTTGDFVAYWTLAAARDAANGDTLQFAASAISFTLD